MRGSEVVGGLAVVGVVALIGLAIADDANSDPLTVPTAPTILAPLDPATSSTPDSAGSTTSVESSSTEPAPETEQAPETTATDRPDEVTTSEATTTSTTSTTLPSLPPDQRDAVRVRVVNAGAAAGGATFVTGVLEDEAFAPTTPGDAVTQVENTSVLHAPGQELAAQAVARAVAADPAFIFLAGDDDPNWAEFGSELDVLVVLGAA